MGEDEYKGGGKGRRTLLWFPVNPANVVPQLTKPAGPIMAHHDNVSALWLAADVVLDPFS